MERLGRVRRRFRWLERVHLHSPEAAVRRVQQARFNVRAASEDLVDLGQALRKKDLNTASFLLDSGEKGKAPSSLRQASRKALLLADGLLISANSGSLGREILVARYYINEFHYATERIADLLGADDVDWAAAAELWRLGADSYNSFFVCVNKAIVPKVGEKFAAVRV